MVAGDNARADYANDEAIAYYRRALDPIAKLPNTASRRRHELDAQHGIGQIYHGVGDDLGTIDEALMNQTAALGHYFCRDLDRWRDLTSRTAQFLRSLPYAEELSPAYVHIWGMHHRYKNVSGQRK